MRRKVFVESRATNRTVELPDDNTLRLSRKLPAVWSGFKVVKPGAPEFETRSIYRNTVRANYDTKNDSLFFLSSKLKTQMLLYDVIWRRTSQLVSKARKYSLVVRAHDFKYLLMHDINLHVYRTPRANLANVSTRGNAKWRVVNSFSDTAIIPLERISWKSTTRCCLSRRIISFSWQVHLYLAI